MKSGCVKEVKYEYEKNGFGYDQNKRIEQYKLLCKYFRGNE